VNRVIVEGYQGGKLMVDEQANVIAYFSRRFALGSSCEVMLGPVLDELLALRPTEHLQRNIEGIDDISMDDNLQVASTYWHTADKIVVSQEKLRQAARWASVSRH
jgi:hypothetical protein